MKKIVLLSAILYLLTFSNFCYSQAVGVSSQGAVPDASSLFDINATGMNPKGGLLVPRLNTTERNAIPTPAQSLIIYNITTKCFEFFENTVWQPLMCTCATPASPGVITGSTTLCSGSAGNVYSISAVSGATSYTWSAPSGATITSGQGTITATVTMGSSSGNMSVTASNACGASAANTLAITINSAPSIPGAITGSASVCSGSTGNVYSISSVSGATSYTWTAPSGATITSGQGTISATVTMGSSSGNMSVTASNTCGTSAANTLAVTINSTPSTPGAITGSASVCSGSTGNVYSISSVSGATSYTWTAPSGATITSGQGTTSATVTMGSSSGNMSVTASNTCGTSAARTLAITINSTPSAPSAGTHTPSQTQIVWNWNTVSGATGYKWNTVNTYSSATDVGASITYTQTGLTCNTAYTLYVWAYNACGNSTSTTLTQTTSSCCVANVGTACDKGSNQLQAGCDANYGCAAFWGVYYGNPAGNCNGASSSSFVEYTGPTCTYVGYASYDPFHYPQPPNGSCFDSYAAGYPSPDTYSKVIAGSGCTHWVWVPDMSGIVQCNGSCQ